jgi:hypothetical protein
VPRSASGGPSASLPRQGSYSKWECPGEPRHQLDHRGFRQFLVSCRTSRRQRQALVRALTPIRREAPERSYRRSGPVRELVHRVSRPPPGTTLKNGRAASSLPSSPSARRGIRIHRLKPEPDSQACILHAVHRAVPTESLKAQHPLPSSIGIRQNRPAIASLSDIPSKSTEPAHSAQQDRSAGQSATWLRLSPLQCRCRIWKMNGGLEIGGDPAGTKRFETEIAGHAAGACVRRQGWQIWLRPRTKSARRLRACYAARVPLIGRL